MRFLLQSKERRCQEKSPSSRVTWFTLGFIGFVEFIEFIGFVGLIASSGDASQGDM